MFTWTVNGIPVSPAAAWSLRPVLNVPVLSRYPQPAGGELTVQRTATIEYALGSNDLTLIGDAEDGNYALDIGVTAAEGNALAQSPAAPSSASATANMIGVVITYEQAYYDHLQACIEKVQDIDHRFSKNRRVGPGDRFRIRSAFGVRQHAIQQMRRALLSTGHAALADQLTHASSTFAGMPRRARPVHDSAETSSE